MSQHTKRCVSHLKAIECCIRCPGAFTFSGEPLSSRNAAFVADLYTIMAALWYSVLPEPNSVNLRWSQHLVRADVRRMVEALKAADEHLVLAGPDPTSFKHWRTSSYPDMGQVFRPIQEMMARMTSLDDMRDIRTCLLFPTRANFPEPLGLEEEAFKDWEAVAARDPIGHVSDAERESLFRAFRRGVRRAPTWDFRPKYGPGHNADVRGTSLREKYSSFCSDVSLQCVGTRVGFPVSDMPRHLTTPLRRCATLRFVPKQLDKMRVISMEPSSLMFYQQGVKEHMVERIHAVFRDHVDLNDADKNRDLAWLGSLTGEYATIDLSHASDSVTYQHVRELVDRSYLTLPLFLTRSREVEYKGEIYQPKFFAPMGSACCFPVETLFFCCIVDAIMRDARDKRAWRVYGDDIILPTDHAERLINRLVDLGFEVNRSKSFYSSHAGFRESCGGEYYQGADVTPVRVSRRFRGLTPKSPTEIEGLIDLGNRLRPFKWARARVVESLKGLNPPPLFTLDGESGLYSPEPTNHRARARWNPGLQREEYQTGLLSQRPGKSLEDDEDIRLFEWLRAHEGRVAPVGDEPTSIVSPSRPRWSATWRSPAPGWQGGRAPVLDESPKENGI